MSFTNLIYHVVFGTKDRRPVIPTDTLARLHAYIGGAIRAEGGIALEVGGIEDHVHVLAKWKADRTLADLMRQAKANSSKWLRQMHPDWPGWQGRYGAFTVSESQVDAVRAYIAHQREHHRQLAFRDELIALLRRNRIEFDERYI